MNNRDRNYAALTERIKSIRPEPRDAQQLSARILSAIAGQAVPQRRAFGALGLFVRVSAAAAVLSAGLFVGELLTGRPSAPDFTARTTQNVPPGYSCLAAAGTGADDLQERIVHRIRSQQQFRALYRTSYNRATGSSENQ